MKPFLFFIFSSQFKRQIWFAFATLAVITALPVMAVFSLGDDALTMLAQAVSSSTIGFYEGPLSKTNLYEWGNCTYWAALKREEIGRPVPNTWGNANTWAGRAQRDGYIVNRTPAPNAIMQHDRGEFGHVAFVTGVDPITGAWTISEMNVKGLNIVSQATYSAAAAANYYFIHDKGI